MAKKKELEERIERLERSVRSLRCALEVELGCNFLHNFYYEPPYFVEKKNPNDFNYMKSSAPMRRVVDMLIYFLGLEVVVEEAKPSKLILRKKRK